MKDAVGNEVNVGDEVMFVPNHYKELYKGVITNITAARVRISYGPNSYVKSCSQFVKVIEPKGSLNVYHIKTVDGFATRVAAKDLNTAIEEAKRLRGSAYSVVSTTSDRTINYKL